MIGFIRNFLHHLRRGWRSPLKWWVVAFVVINVLMDHSGGTNAGSRIAALAAFAERGSYRLDPGYEWWTTDWAQTPDGRYTSNKAPGAAQLATPFYLGLDALSQIGIDSLEAERERRKKTSRPFARILSILLQVIPWALIALVLLSLFQQAGHSHWTQQLFLGAFLAGNTAAVFMNTFFGHGLAAVWLGLLALALYWKSFFWISFFFGWALLTDYGTAWVLPPLFVWILLQRFPLKAWGQFLLGALLPAALWIAHHVHFYGSAFALPNKFQNPVYQDLAKEEGALWGVIRFVPNWESLAQLLWGAARGLLWYQPWLFALFVATPFVWLLRKRINSSNINQTYVVPGALVLFASLFGLLYMNASFGAWHGGHSSGPRYISIVLPFFALLIPFVMDNTQGVAKRVFEGSVIYSTVLGVLILSSTVIFMPKSILSNLIDYYLPGQYYGSAWLRLVVCIFVLFWAWRKVQAELKDSQARLN